MPTRFRTWMLVGCLALPLWAQDVIHFANGDRLTGKIKTLGRGKLLIDAPAIDGDANIDWREIVQIDSERVFQFQTKDGESFAGRIAKDAGPGVAVDDVRIVTKQGDRRLHQDDIVAASQTVGEEGVRQWQADVGAGLSLAKSNSQKQFNVDGSLIYQTTNYRLTSSVSSIFATQESGANTNRHDLNFGFQRKISKRWYLGNITGFQRSEEQKLDKRIIVGGGPVGRIVNTNKMSLFAIGGFIWNHERYQEDAGLENPVVNQVEGLTGISFSYFRFRMLTFDSSMRLFPSITVGGRVRGDFNSSLRIRLARGKKLWWNLSTGLLFDSSPPVNGKGTDYATTTSVSYSFP